MASFYLDQGILTPHTVEMLKEGGFFCVEIEAVFGLIRDFPKILWYYSFILNELLKESLELKQMTSQGTAMAKYKWFLKEYPGLIDRVPLKHVASFIGMTLVTLSRIRRLLREGEGKWDMCLL